MQVAFWNYCIGLALTPLYGIGRLLELRRRENAAFWAYLRAARVGRLGLAYYRVGSFYHHRNNWRLAAKYLRLAVRLDCGRPHWFYKLGHALLQLRDDKGMLRAMERAVGAERTDKARHRRLHQIGRELYDYKRWSDAERFYKQAVQLRPEDGLSHWMVGWCVANLGRTWEAAEAFAKAVQYHKEDPSWFYTCAVYLERMNRLEESAAAYREALSAEGEHSEWHYRLGYVLERLGRLGEAREAYQQAAELDESGNGLQFGPGYFHAEQGLWLEAAAAYEAQIESGSEDAELYYRLGMAYDRCYHWETAAKCYREAIARDTTHAYWHYRLGFVLERLDAWEEAAAAYEVALARDETQSGAWYYRLGCVLEQAGHHELACEAYRCSRVFGRPFDIDRETMEDAAFRLAAEYTEYCETLPVQAHTILYETFHGASLGCNPYALFRYILQSPEFDGWTHIWVLNDKGCIPVQYRALPNVIFVPRDSTLYRRYLATAKYLINNAAFPEFFARRNEQLYLNTWHGTPLKTLGKDIQSPFFEHRNATRNFLHATHLISPNRHTTNVFLDRYELKNVFGGMLAETGYPRIDLTVNATGEERSRLKQKLGIGPNDAVILYAPTWRGSLGSVQYDVERLCGDVRALARIKGTLLFRGHHLMERFLSDVTFDNVQLVEKIIDTNELLSIVDVLVTDYSSIAVDFLATGRGIVHYVYDFEEYCHDRGLYVTEAQLPGRVCRDIEAACDAVADYLSGACLPGEEPQYIEARARWCRYDDGAAAQRVVRMLFGGVDAYAVPVSDGRESVLFFAGSLLTNGITSAFTNLASEIDRTRYQPILAIAPEAVSGTPERLDKFSELRELLPILGRGGRMNLTPEESWVLGQFVARHSLPSTEMWAILRRAYQREFRRMFADVQFLAVVNFEGYALYWAALFGYAPSRAAKHKIIYLHNDMESERLNRFPYLQAIRPLYREYDKLVSVSESINEVNVAHLLPSLGDGRGRFVHCDNPVAIERIRRLAGESLDDAIMGRMNEGGTWFVSMGRLSPEKGHSKLIRAFAQVHREHSDSRLLILGDGPLMHDLTALVAEEELNEVVHLPGVKENPFPFLARAACFVLPSSYEGQGLVVLEALVLGTPVVATDIPGPRSVLEGGYGRLVHNNVEALAEGMLCFLREEHVFRSFNPEAYQRRAMEAFYRNVCGNGPGHGAGSDCVAEWNGPATIQQKH